MESKVNFRLNISSAQWAELMKLLKVETLPIEMDVTERAKGGYEILAKGNVDVLFRLGFCVGNICNPQILIAQKPTILKNQIGTVWNAITANGCLDMDEERFIQAIDELFSIEPE